MNDHPTYMEEALELWQDIIGVRAGFTRGNIGDWQKHRTLEALQEALELDTSELTANLLLSYFSDAFLADEKVSLRRILDDRTNVLMWVEKIIDLQAIVRREEVAEARDTFINKLRQATDSYGAGSRAEVIALLSKQDDIALLRRDALRSIENLKVDQFLRGDPEADDTKPVYTRFVHQWWNVNSMLDAAAKMPSGVSLNLIRDPNIFESYFCFLIRNGGNIYVLSDLPDNAHPLQAQLSRRPDRDLDRRIAKNWFPYDLLGVAYDDESGELYLKHSEGKGLVPFQSEALPLKPISELPPVEMVWITMMLDLVVDRFWRKGVQMPELSYTAEMIRVEDRMLTSAQTANLPVAGYNPISLDPLSIEDVKSGADGLSEAVGKYRPQSNLSFLERRFADQVDETVFNLMAAPERVFLLELASGTVSEESRKAYMSQSRLSFSDSKPVVEKLENLQASSFGSRTKLDADRKFIARFNYVKGIEALAQKEYDATHKDIEAWYRKRVEANASVIIPWTGNGRLWVDETEVGFDHYLTNGPRWRSTLSSFSNNAKEDKRVRSCRSILDVQEIEDTYRKYVPYVVNLGRVEQGRDICAVTGNRATYVADFHPGNAEELALFAGCSVADLPEVLQYWCPGNHYQGNHILSRVDPMAWALNDPWQKLRVAICVPLSKRAMKKLIKTAVIPDYIARNGPEPELLARLPKSTVVASYRNPDEAEENEV